MDKTHLDPTHVGPVQASTDTVKGSPAAHPDGALPIVSNGSNAAGDPPSELRNLGDYRLLRRLGEGGMGAVYLGYDTRHDRQVALKVLNASLVGNQSYIDRFYREARSGILLNHPNIVRTYNVGQDRLTGKYYLVLEYIDGPSAHALLQRYGRLPVGDAVYIALHIARALEHAHSRNIVHRDIKPDNILITRSGVAKLGDLGLARRTDEASHLTATRQGFGTTAYMPYEQAINAKYADGRSDIYALGATLYHLITGQVPFPGENHLEVVEKKNQGVFRQASALEAKVPAVLDHILARMLARTPKDRYQTASELIIDLEKSRLGVTIPSFVDPTLAKNDPLVQQSLSPGEPTKLDPETPRADVPKDTSDEWLVHYQNRGGRNVVTRLSTEEVIARLEEGSLPTTAKTRRRQQEQPQPLRDFLEFRPYVPLEDPVEQEATSLPSDPPTDPISWPIVALMVTSAAVVTGGIVALLRWWS